MKKILKSCWDRADDISYLEVFDIETGETSVLQKFDYLIEAPNWSNDGSFMVYNSGGHVFKFDLATKTSTMIESGYVDACINDHIISPCGKFVAVSHATAEDKKPRIYTIPIEGGQPTLVTAMSPSFIHDWSIDGKTLLFGANRNGISNIYSIPANGGVEKQLTFEGEMNDGAEYDSKMEYIWFHSVRSGMMQVWRMNADGTNETRITFDDENNYWFPQISPDRTKVVAMTYKKGDLEPNQHLPHKNVQLRMMNSDGTDLHTVVEMFGGQGSFNMNSWSPCGKKFAYVRYELPEGVENFF